MPGTFTEDLSPEELEEATKALMDRQLTPYANSSERLKQFYRDDITAMVAAIKALEDRE